MLDGKKLRGGNPASAIGAGIGFCTEDRKKEGLALRLSILLNMTLVRLPLLSKLGVIQPEGQQRAAADEYMKSISIKAPSGQPAGGQPLRRQPAEGGRGQVADDEPQGAHRGRAHPRHRRGFQVGNLRPAQSDLAKQGMAIIVVSSEIEEIMGVCDSVVTIF